MRARGDEIGRQTFEISQGGCRDHSVESLGGTDRRGWDGEMGGETAWIYIRRGQELENTITE